MISVSTIVLLWLSVSLAVMGPIVDDSSNSDGPQVTTVANDASSGKWLTSFDEAKKTSISQKYPKICLKNKRASSFFAGTKQHDFLRFSKLLGHAK